MHDFIGRLSGEANNANQSIVNHITALLNTRCGSLVHMPEYGLPEYTMQHQRQAKKQNFIKQIIELIELYEPRIMSLSACEIKSVRCDCVLQIELSAKLYNQQNLCLEALILGGGDLLVYRVEE